MDIYLDDERTDLDATNLAALVEQVQGRIASTGRMVVEIRFDGEALTAEQMEAAATNPIEAGEIHVYTADPKELALTVLQGAREELEKIDETQKETADLFQSDREPDAMGKMREIIQGWQQVQQAIQQSAEIAGASLEELDVEGESVEALAQRLVDQLRELQELLVNQDTLATADALAYEWPETIQTWDQLVQKLVARIQSDSN